MSDEAGRRLLAAAVDMLNPGGRVWIANFTENLWSSGYMEAVMDWWLVYRSEAQLASMAEYVDPAKIASQRVFFEPCAERGNSGSGEGLGRTGLLACLPRNEKRAGQEPPAELTAGTK